MMTSRGLKIKDNDYQDNIYETSEQENVVEELNDIITRLHNRLNYLKNPKLDLNNFISSNYFENLFYLSMLAILPGVALSTTILQEFSAGLSRNIFLLSLVSMIPTGIYIQKKYKEDKNIRIFNIEQQITEFEEKLNLEQEKLNTLRQTKSSNEYERNNTNKIVYIDNEKIEELSKIRRKKYCMNFIDTILEG